MASSQLRGRSVIAAASSAASVLGLLGVLYWLDIPSLFQQRKKSRKVTPRNYSSEEIPSLTTFKPLVEQTTLHETYPLASSIEKNVPIYDCTSFDIHNAEQIDHLQNELYHILLHGPGVYILKNFFTDLTPIDSANTTYKSIISSEKTTSSSKGDHFAAAGTNDRIWNSFSKHCLHDSSSFLSYYSNPWFKIASEAYLGPAYRITSQVNIVKPGGKAQVSHRDYHLGFQTAEDVTRWPRAIHPASALLTLQGAVAHSDMPSSSGPTRFLPWSQQFSAGFTAYRRPEFDAYFLQNYVSLALKKGDAVFFSPALFHAAGENQTDDFERSANLIQVSSAFGKTMETIDSLPLIEATYDALLGKYGVEGWSAEVEAFVRAVGEGYPFPTNLDRRPPAPGGMAPESEQDVLRKALMARWSKEAVRRAIRQMRTDSQA